MNQERTMRYKRFKEAFDHLRKTGRIVNQKNLADILYKTPETVSKVVSGKGNNPTEKFMLDFARAFSDIFNEDYLVNGRGVLLKEQEPPQDEKPETPEIEEKDIVRKFLDHVSFLERQINEKDKEITRLHSIIEKFAPIIKKEEDGKKTKTV